MAYKNAKDYLPEELLIEVQKYISGMLIYIPADENAKNGWGELTGTRKKLDKRNALIYEDHRKGLTIYDLTSKYYLSEDSIRKIIYSRNKEIVKRS